MARPKKTLKEALKIKDNIVYGLCSLDSDVFYVGKTKNPSKRLLSYKYLNDCHNKELAEHIKLIGELFVVILEQGIDNIQDAEIYWIENIGGHLFNKMSRPYKTWLDYKSKPWQAGVGVRCPSDYLIFNVIQTTGDKKNPIMDEVRLIRDKMSIKKRCCYEIDLYKNAYKCQQKDMNKWFNRCINDLIGELENGSP